MELARRLTAHFNLEGLAATLAYDVDGLDVLGPGGGERGGDGGGGGAFDVDG